MTESRFEIHLCCYVHFRTNTLGKSLNPPIPSLNMGEIVELLFFYKNSFKIKKKTHEGWYAIKTEKSKLCVCVCVCEINSLIYCCYDNSTC